MFMEINRTNIFNNTAQFGGVISACNSQVTLLDDDLFVTVDPLLSFCILYEGDIQNYNITAPRDPEVFTTEFLTTTDQQTTTEPLTTTQRLTTTEALTTTEPSTTTEPLTTTARTTTESQTSELTTEPKTTEVQIPTSEPLTSTEPLSTTEQPAITELLTSTELPITTEKIITNESLPTTTDQIDVSPSATVTVTDPTSTMEENTNIITVSGDTHTLPTTIIKSRTSTTSEGSFLTTSATTMNELTSTTESLGKDIDHFTTRDQTETGVVSDKENDVSIAIVDSKLAISLSATSLASFTVLTVVVFAHILVYYAHKRKAIESKSAKIKLTKMKELTTKTISPTHSFNTYASPVHDRYCSEEKVDMM